MAISAEFACAFNSTSVGTVNGPDNTESAKNFMAWVGPEAAQYLPFTGVDRVIGGASGKDSSYTSVHTYI